MLSKISWWTKLRIWKLFFVETEGLCIKCQDDFLRQQKSLVLFPLSIWLAFEGLNLEMNWSSDCAPKWPWLKGWSSLHPLNHDIHIEPWANVTLPLLPFGHFPVFVQVESMAWSSHKSQPSFNSRHHVSFRNYELHNKGISFQIPRACFGVINASYKVGPRAVVKHLK